MGTYILYNMTNKHVILTPSLIMSKYILLCHEIKIRQRQIIYQDKQYTLYNNHIVNTIAVKQSE